MLASLRRFACLQVVLCESFVDPAVPGIHDSQGDDDVAYSDSASWPSSDVDT